VREDIRENPSQFRYISHMEQVDTTGSTLVGDRFLKKTDNGWGNLRKFSSEQFSVINTEKI
jgi:GTPase